MAILSFFMVFEFAGNGEPAHVVELCKRVDPTWRTVLLGGRVPQDFKETTEQFTSPQITLDRPARARSRCSGRAASSRSTTSGSSTSS